MSSSFTPVCRFGSGSPPQRHAQNSGPDSSGQKADDLVSSLFPSQDSCADDGSENSLRASPPPLCGRLTRLEGASCFSSEESAYPARGRALTVANSVEAEASSSDDDRVPLRRPQDLATSEELQDRFVGEFLASRDCLECLSAKSETAVYHMAGHKGDAYAVKMYSKDVCPREVYIAPGLSPHKGLFQTVFSASLPAASGEEKKWLLVMKYEPCQQLNDISVLRNYVLVDAEQRTLLGRRMAVMRFATELAQVCRHLHHHGLAHRAIHPENILIQKTGSLKLAGLSAVRDIRTESGLPLGWQEEECVARESGQLTPTTADDFSAPEVHRATLASWSLAYDQQVDIWSYGALLHYVATGGGSMLASSESMSTKDCFLAKQKLEVDARLPKSLQDLIRRCTDLSPEKRPSWEEILSSSFIRGYV